MGEQIKKIIAKTNKKEKKKRREKKDMDGKMDFFHISYKY